MQTQAYFENIQQQLILELEKAQQSIYIAVAWFTDGRLFEMSVIRQNNYFFHNLAF